MDIDIRNPIEYLLNEILERTTLTSTETNLLRRNDLISKGVSGSLTISGDAAQSIVSGTHWAVMFIKATTPTVLTMTNSVCVTGIEYPAGSWLYGDIRTITGDANGAYILYYGDAAL